MLTKIKITMTIFIVLCLCAVLPNDLKHCSFHVEKIVTKIISHENEMGRNTVCYRADMNNMDEYFF